jgi:subtilisin family serine protease
MKKRGKRVLKIFLIVLVIILLLLVILILNWNKLTGRVVSIPAVDSKGCYWPPGSTQTTATGYANHNALLYVTYGGNSYFEKRLLCFNNEWWASEFSSTSGDWAGYSGIKYATEQQKYNMGMWKLGVDPNDASYKSHIIWINSGMIAGYDFQTFSIDASGKTIFPSFTGTNDASCLPNQCPVSVYFDNYYKDAIFQKNALLFDGGNDFISLGKNNYNYLGMGSISFWVKSTTTTPQTVFMASNLKSPYDYLSVTIHDAWAPNGITITHRSTLPSGANQFNWIMYTHSARVIDWTKWTHIAIVQDGKEPKLYINGKLMPVGVSGGVMFGSNSVNKGAWFDDLSGDIDYFVGKFERKDPASNLPQTNNYLKGSLDEFYIYKNTLSDLDVKENINFRNFVRQSNSNFAWRVSQGNKNVVIAILDTGMYFDSSSLMGCDWPTPPSFDFSKCSNPNLLWRNTKEVIGNGIDDDKNGYIDDIIGWDFYGNTGDIGDNDPEPPWWDYPSHGTLLAEEIAGQGYHDVNYGLISGVCPNCRLMIIRLETGEFSLESNIHPENLAAAFKYAADNGANIIITSQVGSLGDSGPYASPILHDAIKYAYNKGVLIIGAAGNEGKEGSDYPAKFPEVMSVGWVTPGGKRASYSNYGDVVISADGTYFGLGGTSYAAPVVAGAAGLVKSVNPSLINTQIKQILIDTADPIKTDYPVGGNLNTYRAVLEAKRLLSSKPIVPY